MRNKSVSDPYLFFMFQVDRIENYLTCQLQMGSKSVSHSLLPTKIICQLLKWQNYNYSYTYLYFRQSYCLKSQDQKRIKKKNLKSWISQIRVFFPRPFFLLIFSFCLSFLDLRFLFWSSHFFFLVGFWSSLKFEFCFVFFFLSTFLDSSETSEICQLQILLEKSDPAQILFDP